jgi:hypothetical protein
MTERRPRSLLTGEIKSPSPTERVIQFSRQVARGFELDPMTTEALAKFAVLSYRIKTIKEDFTGTITSRMLYRTDSWQEHADFKYGTMVTRDDFEDKIKLLSTTAFNLYIYYLSHTYSAINAAREVQWTMDDLFSKTVKRG